MRKNHDNLFVYFVLALSMAAIPECVIAQSNIERPNAPNPQPTSIADVPFGAETRTTYSTRSGLPTDEVLSITVADDSTVYAGTRQGLVRRDGDVWTQVTDLTDAVPLVAAHEQTIFWTCRTGLYRLESGEPIRLAALPDELQDPARQHDLIGGPSIWLATSEGLYELVTEGMQPVAEFMNLLDATRAVQQVAVCADGRTAVAAKAGLFLHTKAQGWQRLFPAEDHRSWAVQDVRGVAFDSRNRLWFASPQGCGVLDDRGWTLFDAENGMPFNDFTAIEPDRDGAVWFGTTRGAIYFDGRQWKYRMAPRWLPDNHVRGIATTPSEDTWFATPAGVGRLSRQWITLEQKAEFFEDEIDKYHRRTPFGYVESVRLSEPGDKAQWTQHDSDNDGLWTGMYGAGECFAYAVTKSPLAKQRAKRAFEALHFLSQVTQGGSHPAPHGFPARTIRPTSGPDPNQYDSPQRDRDQQARDPLWKVIEPRWPQSADGKWYWKCDTSSDELDGHYFLYACYYDLVAETEEEKQAVREVVVEITDHLLEHNYQLVDHDGKPTRWGRFSPEVLNGNILEGTRGLNSLSILSYLKVAEHMTGDAKYRTAYQTLIDDHSYATNVLEPKRRNGVGTGNQSDDEMAFMCYYNLLRYEQDPRLRAQYLWSLRWYWSLEIPERCPLFNFIYAALDTGPPSPFLRLPPTDSYLKHAVDTLRQIPLDRILWSFDNRHRLDVIALPNTAYRVREGGHLRDGSVIPVEERGLEHWNQDPWQIHAQHDGKTLADGAAFLLPYYLGRYHGFLAGPAAEETGAPNQAKPSQAAVQQD